MGDLLQVEYTCHGCGVGEGDGGRAKVTVRHRRENQDIVDWVNECARLVSINHHERSPDCRAAKCDLMIPVTKDAEGNEFLGYNRPDRFIPPGGSA